MKVFAEQVAVVTGASSGIGKAIALGLGAEGATLCLVGRKPETLETVAKIAQSTAPRVLCCRTDLTLVEDIGKLTECLHREVGSIDLLIHSAGVTSLGLLESTPVDILESQYRTNVRAPYALTQALLPMLRVRQGQVVFINSSAGISARASKGHYAATKHALKAIADSLREEVNCDELRVLSVFLGRTATPGQATVHKMEGREYQPDRLAQPEDVASVVINALSLPRSAEVTDIHIRPLKKPN